MLAFSDHMRRIHSLTELTIRHVQDDKYDLAREDLFNISINVNEAMQQLDEWIVLLHPNNDPSKNQN